MPGDDTTIRKQIGSHLRGLIKHFQLQNYGIQVESWVADTEYVTVHESHEILLEFAKEHVKPGAVAVPADKDVKRRLFMTKVGYWWRIYVGFFTDPDPKYHLHLPEYNIETLAAYNDACLRYFIPQEFPAQKTGHHIFSTLCIS